MYAWVGLKGWFGESGILGTLAVAASEANIEANDPFYDYEHSSEWQKWARMISYFFVGFLGI